MRCVAHSCEEVSLLACTGLSAWDSVEGEVEWQIYASGFSSAVAKPGAFKHISDDTAADVAPYLHAFCVLAGISKSTGSRCLLYYEVCYTNDLVLV